MNEQPLDLQVAFRAIWRRRFLVGLFVLLGVVISGVYSARLTPVQAARALVILPPSTVTSTGNPKVDDATQVIVATSTPVLAAAGASVSPPIPAATLKSEVVVTPIAEDVLQVQVGAMRASEAEQLANAIAADFVAYVSDANNSADALVSGLHEESTQLTHQILQLQNQINAATSRLLAEGATSAAGERDASLLASLRTEQEQISLQLNSVTNQIFSAEIAGSLSSSGTHVLQKALPVPGSKVATVERVLLGAVIGLVLGCALVLARSRHDRRLRLRDEMAAAIGVPVLASLEATSCKTVKDWRRLLQGYSPSPVDAWSLRRVVHRLVQNDETERAHVSVVALADDRPALAAAVQIAKAASDMGVPAVLVTGQQPALVALRAACEARQALTDPAQTLQFGGDTGGGSSAAVLRVSLVAIDATKPEVPPSNDVCLLAVSSGFATAEALARVALASSDAGSPFSGIVVVNPDSADSTTGSLPRNAETRLMTRRAPHRSGPSSVSGSPL